MLVVDASARSVMAEDIYFQAISRMLENPREGTAHFIEQERVICGPGDFRQALARIEKSLSAFAASADLCRVALLSDDEDECLMVATALVDCALPGHRTAARRPRGGQRYTCCLA